MHKSVTSVPGDRPLLAAAVAASERVLSLFASNPDLWIGDHVDDPRDPAVLRGVELLEDEGLISSESFDDRLTSRTRLVLTRTGRALVRERSCGAEDPALAGGQ